ncbi:hypothetical protein AVEN_143423-1 [Araneus ventricosus]|uniref:Uncharacterized protein n=1 Tax=Araneus ventricosus TaxID=182803 RepID=A0A4Y2AE51_ARAVE|nr:hypothetical protein AVEN_143423-1 [Araneus ventricosus]
MWMIWGQEPERSRTFFVSRLAVLPIGIAISCVLLTDPDFGPDLAGVYVELLKPFLIFPAECSQVSKWGIALNNSRLVTLLSLLILRETNHARSMDLGGYQCPNPSSYHKAEILPLGDLETSPKVC